MKSFAYALLATSALAAQGASAAPKGLCYTHVSACNVCPVTFDSCRNGVFMMYGWASFGSETYKASSPYHDGETLTVYLNDYGPIYCK